MSQNTAPFFVDGSVCFGLVVDSMACLRGVKTHYRYLRMKDPNPGTDDCAVPRTLTCTLDWSLMFVELSSIFKLQGSQEQKRLRRVPRREGGLGNGSGTERPTGTRTDTSQEAPLSASSIGRSRNCRSPAAYAGEGLQDIAITQTPLSVGHTPPVYTTLVGQYAT